MNPVQPDPSPLEPIRKVHLATLFSELGQQLQTRNVQWRQLPGLILDSAILSRHHEASLVRALSDPERREQLTARPQRVNFCPVVKRLIRRRFPNWEFLADDGDRLVFENLVAMRLDLHLIFVKLEWQWRREAFTLKLGVKLGSDDLCREVGLSQNLFALFGAGGPPLWPYTSLEQLEASLDSAAALLAEVLPAFEDLAMQKLFPLPGVLPQTAASRDVSTAWTAWRHAHPLTTIWVPDAGLVFVQGPLSHETLGAVDKRPALPAFWNFTCQDPASGRKLLLSVPRLGPISSLESLPDSSSTEKILPDHLIDSDVALDLANQSLGTAADQVLEVGFALVWDPPRCGFAHPVWQVNCHTPAPVPTLNFRIVTIDALEARVLDVKNT